MNVEKKPAEKQVKKRIKSRFDVRPRGTRQDNRRNINWCEQNAFERALHLFLPNRVGERGKSDHKIIEHRHSGQPRDERILPLFVLRVDEIRNENARDKIKRRDDAENPQQTNKKFDAIRKRELKIPDDESANAAQKIHNSRK